MSDPITLILAEKPSVAKAVAAWLSKKFGFSARSVGTHINVGPYRVGWLFGHLLENCEPHEYDKKYAKWSMDHLPFIAEVRRLRIKMDRKTGKIDEGAERQVKAIAVLLKECDRVIGLGDPDQEGQLLQDELLIWLGNTKPVDRLWLAAVDDASISKAWAAMKPNAAYEGYYWSALARSHADFDFGINGTRAATLSSQANGGNATLTLGRVQTPTLGLVVQLELAIRAFKPVNYFTPFIELHSSPAFKAEWAPDKDADPRLDPEGRLLDKTVANGIVAACRAEGVATVSSVKSVAGKELAPLPFSLSALQEWMSKRFSMGVAETLAIAQKLYEKKIASYPRTDNEHLPEDQFSEAATIIDSLACVPHLGTACGRASTATKPRAYDDKHTSAHHAIAPRPITEAQYAALSSDERKVWDEIAKRFLIQFFPVATFQTSEIELVSGKETFRVKGKVYTSRGWKDAFVDDVDDEEKATPALPKVSKGDVLKLAHADLQATTTKPPKRYTEGTLVAAMKNVHKFVMDPKLKAVLRENVGIGTEATRANTITELFGRKFLETVGKKDIKPSELAIQYITTLPAQLTAPDMTAIWQQNMDDIRKTGKPGYEAFMKAQAKWLVELVKDIPTWFAGKAMTVAGKKSGGLETKPTTHTCLKCGGPLNHVKGKFGWFFGCRDLECKTIFKDVEGKPVAKMAAPTEALSVEGVKTGDVCPKCGKGTMQTRVCGEKSKTPGKAFLSCSNYFQTAKSKRCEHSLWPK
ncbi:DNA topoisomerase [Comamonas thiooxydans]|uniref:DNA topoisomerase n=1 Tax=Comamonas thiooxydans TaxID=363952 RepID=UPI000B410F21|nr:DNA topoisomerase [Comamonas thiooxydans]